MGQISLQIPQIGQPDTTEDVKVANNFSTIQTAVNGNLDSTNVAATLAQSAGVNQSGQTVKGSFIKLATDSTTSTSFGTLSTPDQVTGLTLGANGLIFVYYRAQWVSNAGSGGSAAIFLNSNQLVTDSGAAAPTAQVTTSSSSANFENGLATWMNGLAGQSGASISANDPTTGMILGSAGAGGGGGATVIFAAAGTYTVSVQFKSSAGATTQVSNRRLYVEVRNFV